MASSLILLQALYQTCLDIKAVRDIKSEQNLLQIEGCAAVIHPTLGYNSQENFTLARFRYPYRVSVMHLVRVLKPVSLIG